MGMRSGLGPERPLEVTPQLLLLKGVELKLGYLHFFSSFMALPPWLPTPSHHIECKRSGSRHVHWGLTESLET